MGRGGGGEGGDGVDGGDGGDGGDVSPQDIKVNGDKLAGANINVISV